ncbi:AAA family ATPase, partial [Streptomyces sp. NPDC001348]
MTGIFVDRESERQQLLDLAAAVASGAGGIRCVEGPAGIGKTALLNAFQEAAASIPGVRISKVTCHGQIGALVQRALYERQSGQLRRDRHLSVAEALDRLLRAVADPPRDLLLDLGRHYHLGGAMEPAARHNYRMAMDLARSGSSFAEVTALCTQAMRDLRRLPGDGGEHDRLRLGILELLLVTSETYWEASDGDGNGVLGLATEAARAADRVGDGPLRARAAFLHGKILLHTRGAEASLHVLAEALARTDKETDPVDWFLIAAEYGAQLTQRDLVRGMALMHEAEELLHREPRLRDAQDPVVRLIADQLEQHLGINHLDAGDPHGAQARLTAVLERLRERGATDQLQPPLNYLAQTRIALGDFTGARELLEEAVGLTARPGTEDSPASAWHAYQVALLGHVAVLTNDTDGALELLRASVAEADRSGIVSIAPRVHNYLAQALLETRPVDDHRVAEAEALAAASAESCRRAGTTRSEVVAWSLVARARLARGAAPGGSAGEYRRRADPRGQRGADSDGERRGDLLPPRTDALRHGRPGGGDGVHGARLGGDPVQGGLPHRRRTPSLPGRGAGQQGGRAGSGTHRVAADRTTRPQPAVRSGAATGKVCREARGVRCGASQGGASPAYWMHSG